MSISIRTATYDDVPAILEIVNHSIVNTTANYNYEPLTLEAQQKWFDDKRKNNYPIFVAERQGELFGFGTYGMFREKIGYRFTVEHSVYVTAAHIGKGIGKLLLQTLIDSARQQGYHVMIGGIDASNTGSIAFHKSLGFTECGVIKEAGFKFDRWLDLLFMQLILDPVDNFGIGR